MATHSDTAKPRDQLWFPGSQPTDLRITVLDPKIYHLAPRARTSIMTYVLLLRRKYIRRYLLHNKRSRVIKQNEQEWDTKVIEREEWISLRWIPVVNAKENTLPRKAQTELCLQFGEWTLCHCQENSHCTFIPHHFFRATAEWQYSSPSFYSSTTLYTPACSQSTALNQHTGNFL